MEFDLNLRQELSIDPWYWDLSNEEMRENFKNYLIEEKGYQIETSKNRTGIMVSYLEAIDNLAKSNEVSLAFIGVNVDEYIAKCNNANKIQLKALRLYKEFVS